MRLVIQGRAKATEDLRDLANFKKGFGIATHTYPNSNRSMAHVGFPSLRDWVIVDIDDLVEILGDNLRYLFQSVEIEDFFLCIDKLIDSNGG